VPLRCTSSAIIIIDDHSNGEFADLLLQSAVLFFYNTVVIR
jgi:hypothetical protein